MKQIIICLVTVIIFSVGTTAQDVTNISQHKSPKWISEKGYWVMESNIHSNNRCIVYFYNNNNQLVYSETIEGKVLNIKKRKVKMDLKKILEQTVTAFEQKHQPSENQMLVSRSIK